ncbi:MAG TPA: transposase [Noviherbaspirillum sp.]|nr:transposase [Noviherbaspirillum sp.]
MARPLRLEFESALYHVTTRGDRREPIFEDDADREALLEVVRQGVERFDVVVYAYCLMSNHYHFVLQTRQPNLSRLMRHVNGVYTQAYNRRHRKVGHLFQGRFKAEVVDGDSYFLEVCRYVDLNPVRAGMVKRPEDWAWSSYRAHTNRAERPAWLDSAALYRQLSPRAPLRHGPVRYAEFVAQGHGVKLWEEALKGQIYLGGEEFVRRMQVLASGSDEKDVPRAQGKFASQPLQRYFDQHDRDEAIALAFTEGGYTQTEIAEKTGLSISRISRLIKAVETKSKT